MPAAPMRDWTDGSYLLSVWRKRESGIIQLLGADTLRGIRHKFHEIVRASGTQGLYLSDFLSIFLRLLGAWIIDEEEFLMQLLELFSAIDLNVDGTVEWEELLNNVHLYVEHSLLEGSSSLGGGALHFSYGSLDGSIPARPLIPAKFSKATLELMATSAVGGEQGGAGENEEDNSSYDTFSHMAVYTVDALRVGLPMEEHGGGDASRTVVIAFKRGSMVVHALECVLDAHIPSLKSLKKYKHESALQAHRVLAATLVPDAMGRLVTCSEAFPGGPSCLNVFAFATGLLLSRVPIPSPSNLLIYEPYLFQVLAPAARGSNAVYALPLVHAAAPERNGAEGGEEGLALHPSSPALLVDHTPPLAQGESPWSAAVPFLVMSRGFVAVGSLDGTVRLWDPVCKEGNSSTGWLRECKVLAHPYGVGCLAFSRSRSVLVSTCLAHPSRCSGLPASTYGVHLWDVSSWLAFIRSAMAAQLHGTVVTTRLPSVSPRVLLGHRQPITACTLQEEAGGPGHLVSLDEGGVVRVWSMAKECPIQVLCCNNSGVVLNGGMGLASREGGKSGGGRDDALGEGQTPGSPNTSDKSLTQMLADRKHAVKLGSAVALGLLGRKAPHEDEEVGIAIKALEELGILPSQVSASTARLPVDPPTRPLSLPPLSPLTGSEESQYLAELGDSTMGSMQASSFLFSPRGGDSLGASSSVVNKDVPSLPLSSLARQALMPSLPSSSSSPYSPGSTQQSPIPSPPGFNSARQAKRLSSPTQVSLTRLGLVGQQSMLRQRVIGGGDTRDPRLPSYPTFSSVAAFNASSKSVASMLKLESRKDAERSVRRGGAAALHATFALLEQDKGADIGNTGSAHSSSTASTLLSPGFVSKFEAGNANPDDVADVVSALMTASAGSLGEGVGGDTGVVSPSPKLSSPSSSRSLPLKVKQRGGGEEGPRGNTVTPPLQSAPTIALLLPLAAGGSKEQPLQLLVLGGEGSGALPGGPDKNNLLAARHGLRVLGWKHQVPEMEGLIGAFFLPPSLKFLTVSPSSIAIWDALVGRPLATLGKEACGGMDFSSAAVDFRFRKVVLGDVVGGMYVVNLTTCTVMKQLDPRTSSHAPIVCRDWKDSNALLSHGSARPVGGGVGGGNPAAITSLVTTSRQEVASLSSDGCLWVSDEATIDGWVEGSLDTTLSKCFPLPFEVWKTQAPALSSPRSSLSSFAPLSSGALQASGDKKRGELKEEEEGVGGEVKTGAPLIETAALASAPATIKVTAVAISLRLNTLAVSSRVLVPPPRFSSSSAAPPLPTMGDPGDGEQSSYSILLYDYERSVLKGACARAHYDPLNVQQVVAQRANSTQASKLARFEAESRQQPLYGTQTLTPGANQWGGAPTSLPSVDNWGGQPEGGSLSEGGGGGEDSEDEFEANSGAWFHGLWEEDLTGGDGGKALASAEAAMPSHIIPRLHLPDMSYALLPPALAMNFLDPLGALLSAHSDGGVRVWCVHPSGAPPCSLRILFFLPPPTPPLSSPTSPTTGTLPSPLASQGSPLSPQGRVAGSSASLNSPVSLPRQSSTPTSLTVRPALVTPPCPLGALFPHSHELYVSSPEGTSAAIAPAPGCPLFSGSVATHPPTKLGSGAGKNSGDEEDGTSVSFPGVGPPGDAGNVIYAVAQGWGAPPPPTTSSGEEGVKTPKDLMRDPLYLHSPATRGGEDGCVVWIGDSEGFVHRYFIPSAALAAAGVQEPVLPVANELSGSSRPLQRVNNAPDPKAVAVALTWSRSRSRAFAVSQGELAQTALQGVRSRDKRGGPLSEPSPAPFHPSLSHFYEQPFRQPFWPAVGETLSPSILAFPVAGGTPDPLYTPITHQGTTLGGPVGVVWECSWRAHSKEVSSISVFSDSGTHGILTGSLAGKARVWDHSGRLVGTLDGSPFTGNSMPYWEKAAREEGSGEVISPHAPSSSFPLPPPSSPLPPSASVAKGGGAGVGPPSRESLSSSESVDPYTLSQFPPLPFDAPPTYGPGVGSGRAFDPWSMHHVVSSRVFDGRVVGVPLGAHIRDPFTPPPPSALDFSSIAHAFVAVYGPLDQYSPSSPPDTLILSSNSKAVLDKALKEVAVMEERLLQPLSPQVLALLPKEWSPDCIAALKRPYLRTPVVFPVASRVLFSPTLKSAWKKSRSVGEGGSPLSGGWGVTRGGGSAGGGGFSPATPSFSARTPSASPLPKTSHPVELVGGAVSPQLSPCSVLGERDGAWSIGEGWQDARADECGLLFTVGQGRMSLEGGEAPREDDRSRWHLGFDLVCRRERQLINARQAQALLSFVRLSEASHALKGVPLAKPSSYSRSGSQGGSASSGVEGSREEGGEAGDNGAPTKSTRLATLARMIRKFVQAPTLEEDAQWKAAVDKKAAEKGEATGQEEASPPEEGDESEEAAMRRFSHHPLAGVLSKDPVAAALHQLLEDDIAEEEAREAFGASRKHTAEKGESKLSAALGPASLLNKKAMEERVAKARHLMALERAQKKDAEEDKARTLAAKVSSEFVWVDEKDVALRPPPKPSHAQQFNKLSHVVPTALDKIVAATFAARKN